MLTEGSSYIEEVTQGAFSKMIVSAVVAGGIELIKPFYHGELLVLNIWLGFILADFILGAIRAYLWGVWRWRELMRGIRKFLIYLSSIAMVNFLCWSLSLTTDIAVSLIINFYVFMLTLTEAASLVTNCEALGWEVPPTLKWLIHKWRKKSISMMAKHLGEDETDLEMISKILHPNGCRRDEQQTDTGDRRRKTDALDNGGEVGAVCSAGNSHCILLERESEPEYAKGSPDGEIGRIPDTGN